MDTDLILMITAGCAALIIIAASARLTGRRKASVQPKAGEAGPRDDNNLFEQFKRFAAAEPNNPDLWLKWGKELSAVASTAKHPNMRLHRYNEACSCFQSATEINPNLIAAWESWGQTLYAIYRLQDCEGRLTLDNAHTKFQTAVRLAPADATVWQHWGEELYMTASYCQNAEQRQELQYLANSKFTKAVQLNPDLLQEWKKWGGSENDIQSSLKNSASGSGKATASGMAGGETLGNAPAAAEVAAPWAHGTSTPQEASPWLTQPAAAPAHAEEEEQPQLSSVGGKTL